MKASDAPRFEDIIGKYFVRHPPRNASEATIEWHLGMAAGLYDSWKRPRTSPTQLAKLFRHLAELLDETASACGDDGDAEVQSFVWWTTLRQGGKLARALDGRARIPARRRREIPELPKWAAAVELPVDLEQREVERFPLVARYLAHIAREGEALYAQATNGPRQHDRYFVSTMLDIFEQFSKAFPAKRYKEPTMPRPLLRSSRYSPDPARITKPEAKVFVSLLRDMLLVIDPERRAEDATICPISSDNIRDGIKLRRAQQAKQRSREQSA